MNLLLGTVSSQLLLDTHAAMLIDNAGWHVANDLRVPSNIALFHLPSCSAELNAIAKICQYLRVRPFSGRLFSGTCAIVDACCVARNRRIARSSGLSAECGSFGRYPANAIRGA